MEPAGNHFITEGLTMPKYAPLTNYPMFLPSAHRIQVAYEDYKVDSNPCKGGVKNQCAIRMSIALWRCGFSLDNFDFPSHRMHSHRKSCKVEIPHAVGAEDLARFLDRTWVNTLRFAGSRTESAATELQGRRGVIFFYNCWHRSTDKPGEKNGDHIDFWNGEQYFNQIIHKPAGKEDASSVGSMFGSSKEVWFFDLPY